MGVIKSTKITPSNKVEYTVSIDYEESLILKGHVTNAHVFSEECADIKTNIVSRGKGNTKYIRVPKRISREMKDTSLVRCLRLDSVDNVILIMMIKK